MNKIIFLDIYGVLNVWNTPQRMMGEYGGPGVTGICPARAGLFRRILMETGAEFVISSSWRNIPRCMNYFWSVMGEELRQSCAGQTPVVSHDTRERWREIKAWLASRPAGRFVILDDIHHVGPFAREWIVTSMEEGGGLNEEVALRAISQLNAP